MSDAKRTTDKNKYFAMTMAHKCPIEFPCLCRICCRPCNLLDALSSTIQSFTCCFFFHDHLLLLQFLSSRIIFSRFEEEKKKKCNDDFHHNSVALFLANSNNFSINICVVFIEKYSTNFYAVAYVYIGQIFTILASVF